MGRAARLVFGLLVLVNATSAQEPQHGAIARGPLVHAGAGQSRRIALLFTGHAFAEGGTTILDELARRQVKASFFLTGDFLRREEFAPLVRRMVSDGHYLGPHSDKHLLYAGWEASRPTLVTREVFRRDVEDNLKALGRFGVDVSALRYWVPAYEWFNDEIVEWSEALGLRVITFTRGTRASADYTGEGDTNFVSSDAIVDSILAREREPDGLDGSLLLMHVGSGSGRRDKLHDRLGGLLDELDRRGYRFVRVDALLKQGGRGAPGAWPLAAGTLAQVPAPFFPMAVWYSGGKARAPMLSPIGPESETEWRADLTTIKRLGFNTVRTWVEWSAGEPREGEYRLDNLDLMLRLAEQQGLRVIVQVYVDSAPEWVGRKYPDGQFVAQSGAVIRSQAAPGSCVDHPGVRQAVHGFFAQVARRASASPAFYAYDLWSEPAVMNWALPAYVSNAQFCYCPHSMARFREWLRQKHGSLAALNRAWYRTFRDWSEVEPPRFGTILTYADFMDWRVFIGDKIAADLAGRAAAVREVDAAHLVTSHAPNPSPAFRTLADAMDASDDYLMAASVDYFGTSFYPKLTSPDRDFPLERRALVMDLVHAVTGGKGFFVGELQAGYGVHGIIAGNPVTGSDLELHTWGLLARGARSISYYAFYPMSTGYESGGYGLIQLDGTLTERSRRAGATARLVADNADLLTQATPDAAQVAVVFNPLVPLLGGEQAYGDRRSMHRAIAGYHRMFFERNIRVDVPSARNLRADALRHYTLVIVPYPILLSRDMAAALEEYVSQGGHLFVEARPGWQDERGHAEPILPGFGWHRLFGVRESQVLPVKQVDVRWGERRFTGTSFAEHFDRLDEDARVVATFEDGTPAAYERRHGRGRAIILGTFAGERNQLEPAPMHPLADILIEWAGVMRPAMRSSAFVELRRASAPKGDLVLLLNHGTAAADVNATLPLTAPPARVRELITGTSLPTSAASLVVRTTVPGESVRVYRVEY